MPGSFHPVDVLSSSGRLVRIRKAAAAEHAAACRGCRRALHQVDPGALRLVAEVDGRIVGGLVVVPDDDCHVAHLCLHPDERGDGIARRLIEQAFAALDTPARRRVTLCPT